jgi:hypothetical protein
MPTEAQAATSDGREHRDRFGRQRDVAPPRVFGGLTRNPAFVLDRSPDAEWAIEIDVGPLQRQKLAPFMPVASARLAIE